MFVARHSSGRTTRLLNPVGATVGKSICGILTNEANNAAYGVAMSPYSE
jgi:hypothetical protein